MSLIISQSAFQRLPDALVKNAVMVKNAAYETGQADSPAEKMHSGAPSQFDSVSISAEGLRSQGISRLSYPDGTEELSLNTGASQPFVAYSSDAVLDITDPAEREKQASASAVGRYMRGWNSLIERLKAESEGEEYDYDRTIKLFREETRSWEKSIQKTDQEAWREWHKKLAEWGVKWL